MLMKTILNHVQRFKSFVYWKIYLNIQGELDIEIRSRQNSKPICSGCGVSGSCYDHYPQRRYEYVPLWGIRTFFLYSPRRVDCVLCGPTIERVPWSEGKHQHTNTFRLFLAHWAKKLSWKEVANEFRTTWQHVFHAVAFVVEYGLEHRDLSGITAVGIDEIHWSTSKGFVTVVYQIDALRKRLLWVAKKRSVKSILGFFRMLGKERTANLKFICSDMWKPYLRVIKKKASQALHILDRFHITSNLNKALDEVRAKEARALAAKGYEPLKSSRWCFLKRPENLTDKQSVKLKELLRVNLKTVRAYLLKEEFSYFWDYTSATWASKFLTSWTSKVLRSRIQPLMRMARQLRAHQPLLLNWFKAHKLYSSGVVEGFNNKAKVTLKKAYGFRTFDAMQIALFHQLGALSEPKTTHQFW
jgi:transposase